MIGLIAVARSFIRAVRRLARDPESRGLLTVALGLIGAGTLFYRQVEDLSWLDSVYFTVITLTTVGYGDIAPATAAGKIFTMVYLLIGVGLIVTLATQIGAHMVEARRQLIERREDRRNDG